MRVKAEKRGIYLEKLLRILEDQELQPVLTREDLEVIKEVREYLGEV